MNTTTPLNQNRRGGRLLLIGIAVLIAGLFALPTTVEAHGRHNRGGGHHAREYNHHGYGRVPHRISARHRQQHGHYYSGRSYDRRHRHHHSVYRFPVFIGGRLAYRSYSYCGDSLYLRGGGEASQAGSRPGIRWAGRLLPAGLVPESIPRRSSRRSPRRR